MARLLASSLVAALAFALAGLAGCVRTPPPLGDGLESPPPPAPPASPWRFFSDGERLVDVAVTPTALWAISQDGVLRWTRPAGQVSFFEGAGAPGADATAIAVAGDGTVYVGLKDAIAWLRPEPGAKWQRLAADPLPAGVTALAPRKAGGVWVGMQRGLGWMHGGRLRLHSRLHTVRAMATDEAGRLWAATARKGLVTIEGDRIVEHTTVSGLCNNDVRAVDTGGNQVAVVCNTPEPTIALRVRNTWYPFALSQGGATILGMQWHTGNWVIRSSGGWWRVVEVPMGTAPDPKAPPARLDAIEPGRLPPPPALVQHAGFVKPVAAAAAPAPGETPAAAPITPAPAPLAPVEEVLLECTRAPARVADAAGALDLRLLVERPDLPDDTEVTVWEVEPDGFAWYGLAWRGVLGRRGQATQRFTSQSLVPRHAVTALSVDAAGRALIPAAGPYLFRWDGRGWARRPIAPVDSKAESLAAAPDSAGGAWLLIGYPPSIAPAPAAAPVEADPIDAIAGVAPPAAAPAAAVPTPEIALVRVEQARLERKARLPVLGIDRPLRAGRLLAAPWGEVLFPLFFEDARGQLRGAGLGRIPASHDAFERWQARRTYTEESVDGTPLLPDGWINALARGRDRAVLLGTNAGLVRVAGEQMRVFDENDFIESEVITALALDGQGRVWAGTLEGLGRLEGDTWTAVKAPALRGRRVSVLVFGPKGALWAGSEAGLYVNPNPEDPAGWRLEVVRLGESARDVRDLVFGADGSAWLLTGQGVMFRPPQGE